MIEDRRPTLLDANRCDDNPFLHASRWARAALAQNSRIFLILSAMVKVPFHRHSPNSFGRSSWKFPKNFTCSPIRRQAVATNEGAPPGRCMTLSHVSVMSETSGGKPVAKVGDSRGATARRHSGC